MDEATLAYQLGALLLIVYTILASGYYSEAARWSDRTAAQPDGDQKEKSKRNMKRAEVLFRTCSAFMAFALLCTILPMYTKSRVVAEICKWALLLPLGALVYACARFLSKRYWVELD